MKLNQGLGFAAALVVGALAVTGCSKSVDGATDVGATNEQASVTAAANEGFEKDCQKQGSAAPGVEHAAYRRGGHLGFRRGEGRRRGERFVRRPWWRIW